MIWYNKYVHWAPVTPTEDRGILVGSDISQEWLLPWWWGNYSKHNSFPVTFVDLGLSLEKKKWCEERGKLVSLPPLDFLIQDKSDVSSINAALWEAKYGDNFWHYRKAWFKKPLACLLSPYFRTLWLDLDCEVLGSLKPIFEIVCGVGSLALARDSVDSNGPYTIYNSGVLAFERGLELFPRWATDSLEKNSEYRGDQDLLSKLIFELKVRVCELSPIYNWNVGFGENDKAVICHWVGEWGKKVIREQMAIRQFL